MQRFASSVALAAAFLSTTALSSASADVFNRIATFHVADNRPADSDPKAETVSEIIAATADGMTLVYTDSPGERVGIIDIADPAAPQPGGVVALGGEPTSVVIVGGSALVGVVTSASYAEPSGHLAVVDIAGKSVTATCDLGGQPDSLALSPDGSYLAIAIENERDEDVNDGNLPQMPAGNLTTFAIKDGVPDCASRKVIDLTGIAAVEGSDPEPEFVDINADNQVVVTLQENNHIVLVDLASGAVVNQFSAGTVDLVGIDAKRDGVMKPVDSKMGVAREPDAVQWIDNDRFVTADEGDWKGGSRTFTIFGKDGSVLFDPGASVEHQVMRLGHYPEHRSGSKGAEPEGAEVATFGGEKLLFIGLERASLVLVYRDNPGGEPEYLQALPGGIGPEGLLAIPGRDLFVTASETDLLPDGLVGSVVTIYQRQPGEPAYPTLVSTDDADGNPITWGAISGAAADPSVAGMMHVITDSAYSEARILTVDATRTPALITAAVTVMEGDAPAKLLDLEGIAVSPEGGFWLASEGNPEREKDPTDSLLVKVAADGTVEETVALPEALRSQAIRFGFEGVTVTGAGADETVWLAVQREWKDDPKGMVKLLAYKPADKSWGMVHYPLDKGEVGWVGLSEITATADGKGLIVVERDNQVGQAAKIKQLTYVSLEGVTPVAVGAAEIPVVKKTVVRDLIPDLLAPGGFVLDKVESFAIDAAGDAYIITDNDGVDDHSGETQFIRLGKIALPM